MKQEGRALAQMKDFLQESNSPLQGKRSNTNQVTNRKEFYDFPIRETENDLKQINKISLPNFNNPRSIEHQMSLTTNLFKDTPVTPSNKVNTRWQETIEAIDRKNSRQILTQESVSPYGHSPFFIGDDVFTIEQDEKREDRERNNEKKLNQLKLQNKNFQKKSLLELVSMFSSSTTDSPTTIYNPRNTSTEPRMSTAFDQSIFRSTDSYGFKKLNKPVIIQEYKKEPRLTNLSKPIDNYIPIEDMIPNLVDIAQLKFHECLFVKYYSEFPKIKSIDWEKILGELQTSKLEIYVIDPIFVTIEGYYEIPIDLASINLNEKLQYCLRELSAFHNEAKHILGHHNYNKGLKNEKEATLYYFLVLGMLEFKIKYEHNPNLTDKLESIRAKAIDIIKGVEEPSQYLIDWFTRKIEPFVNIEKSFYHQNIKGKANSNYVFNIKEYFEIAFAKYISKAELQRNDSKKSLIPMRRDLSPENNEIGSPTSPNRIKWARIEIHSNKDIRRLELVPNDLDLLTSHRKKQLENSSKIMSKEDLSLYKTPSDMSLNESQNGATKQTIQVAPPKLRTTTSVGNLRKKLAIRTPLNLKPEFIELKFDKDPLQKTTPNFKASNASNYGLISPKQASFYSSPTTKNIYRIHMNNTSDTISIDKKDYFKTYLSQRESLHIHLLQQLLAKSEAKKQVVIQQANEMIDKFVDYRDEFLRNIPAQMKKVTVKDYVGKYDGNFQKCLSSIKLEEEIQIQNASEKVNSVPESQTILAKQNSNDSVNGHVTSQPTSFNQNKIHHVDDAKQNDESVLEMINSLENKEPLRSIHNKDENKHKVLSKQNTAEIFPPTKSSKKRNRENFEDVLKENKNILNTPSSKQNMAKTVNWSASKVMNILNKNASVTAKVMNIDTKLVSTPQANKSAKVLSPSKKPWMP